MYKIVFITILGLFTSCLGIPTEEPETENELLQIWRVDHGTAGDAPPIVHEDRIIMSGGLFVYALQEKTGEEIWKYQFDEDNILEGEIFLINGNQVAVAHIDKIRAWDILDGSLEWEFDYEVNGLEPRLIGKHITFQGKYGFTSEGSKFFVLNNSGGIDMTKQLDSEFGVQGLTYNNNKLYVGQGNTIHGLLTIGRVTVLNAQTGDSLWAYNTERSGVGVAPIVENDILYAGTRGNSPENTFVALDAETGELIWEHTNSEILTRSFVIGPKYVFVNTGGKLIALNKINGQKVWSFNLRSSSGLIKPVYLNEYVYHSNHGSLFVLDAETGELVHTEPSPGGYFWHLAVSKDKLFAQTSNQLIAYQPWHLRED